MTFLSFIKDFGGYIVWGITLIMSIVLYFCKRGKKGSKITLTSLYEKIPELVATAEELFKGTGMGAAKLNHVVTQLSLDALKAGFNLDTNKITDMVNKIVDASRIVNSAPSGDADGAKHII